MSTFIEMLEEMAARDSKVRAVLKRSLSFEPGTYPPAFPFVETRLGAECSYWKRAAYYLVAGLWALQKKDGQKTKQTLPTACGSLYLASDNSPSTEKRFVALLDSDEEQLPNRLRRMVSLLKEHMIDFDALLSDIVSWNNPKRVVQVKWAREFYRS
jgi:CRISPR system Cascade subunit CasB